LGEAFFGGKLINSNYHQVRFIKLRQILQKSFSPTCLLFSTIFKIVRQAIACFKVEKILKGSLDSIITFAFSENSNYGRESLLWQNIAEHCQLLFSKVS
jgi:hypothetical protein